MPKAPKTKLYHNHRSKRVNIYNNDGIKVRNSTIESLIKYNMNKNTLLVDDITKEMYVLGILGVFKY